MQQKSPPQLLGVLLLLLDDGRERVVGSALVAEAGDFLDGLVEGDRLAAVLRRRVVAVSHVDLSALDLLVSDD